MVQLSGQRGVPVITVDNQVIVGFDRQRLEQILAREERPQLGAAVADAQPHTGEPGAYVGRVHPGSVAERAGLVPGDVIVELNKEVIRSAQDVERIVAQLRRGASISVTYLRQGQRLRRNVTL